MKTVMCSYDFDGTVQTVDVSIDKELIFVLHDNRPSTFTLHEATPYITATLQSQPHKLWLDLGYDSEPDTRALFAMLENTSNQNLRHLRALQVEVHIWDDNFDRCARLCDDFMQAMQAKLQAATNSEWSATRDVISDGVGGTARLDIEFKLE